MADNKTQPTEAKVLDFVHSLENTQRQADALLLLDIFAKITKQDAMGYEYYWLG